MNASIRDMADVNRKYAQLLGFFLTLFCLVFFASIVHARDVTFSWTANTGEVDGYRLYYKAGVIGGSPYDGTVAIEGDSPVETGKVTIFTLHGLSDSETYHFVLTAYSGSEESDYSTEITVEPLPLTAPSDIAADFSWIPNEETDLAGYKIHYGTASGDYTETIDVGKPEPVDGRIQAQVSGLIEGTTYYFVATAYDSAGVESDYSEEVVWTATLGGKPSTPWTATLGGKPSTPRIISAIKIN